MAGLQHLRAVADTAGMKVWWVRKKLLINKRFQIRFIAFCALTAIVACGAFYGASHYFFYDYLSIAHKNGLPDSNPMVAFASVMSVKMAWLFALISVGVVAFTSVAGMIYSHRIAGPLHRLRTHCERVAKGETMDDIRFRKEDASFADVAKAYNRQMDYLRSKIKDDSRPIKKAA
jgi:hypothetical protein